MRTRDVVAAVAGVASAAIYPAARRRSFGTVAEKAVLVAASGIAIGAAVRGGRSGRSVIAAGWLAHAGFDAAFTPHRASRIPSWYPALCAGYDVAVAARLATSR